MIGNKVGARRGPAGEWLIDSRPETVRAQVEDALLDMRAEVSPLTYLRLPGDSQALGNSPAEGTPLEESLGALVELLGASPPWSRLSSALPERVTAHHAATYAASGETPTNRATRTRRND